MLKFKYKSKSGIVNVAKRAVLFLGLTVATALFATGFAKSEEFFDTKGTDFWLTYIPNFHNYIDQNSDYMKYGDSLYIYIAASEATSGQIEYFDRFATPYLHEFDITNPDDVYIFKVSYYDYELWGYNHSGSIGNRRQSEQVAPQSFRVTSDVEVSVYAHSQANTTSDAFLVMPSDVLGKNYYVVSYNSDAATDTWGRLESFSTPSQFAVVATEDNTAIEIIPSCPTRYNGTSTQNIVLNKGECYLVQAEMAQNELNNDFTGTKINSDKPVAVFAGHQRATIPVYTDFGTSSRDVLIEQMPPLETWGKNAFLIPYAQVPDATALGTDLYRILAAYDDTEVKINGVSEALLNAGEFYEGKLLNPSLVEADGPILVAQYKKTAQGPFTYRPSSDPFLMMIPPVEQFQNNYRFINTQAYEWVSGFWEKVYDAQYVAVVAPRDQIANVRLDGAAVNSNLFRDIPNTDYAYANIRTSDGVHAIECPKEIGIYVYGFGPANSYGYVGGMSLKPFDFRPPAIDFNVECYEAVGFVTDTMDTDTKIRKVEAPLDKRINCDVSVAPFEPLLPIVSYGASLIDVYQDGKFAIVAEDSVGNEISEEIDIPGFTLELTGFPVQNDLPYYEKIDRVKKRVCADAQIRNYGSFTQSLIGLSLANDSEAEIIIPQILTEVLPGESVPVQVCFESDTISALIDTLLIEGECGIRNVAIFNITFIDDGNNPQISFIPDSCYEDARITITDSTITDYGLMEIEIDYQENCEITELFRNARIANYSASVIDRRYDAFYQITAIDSTGKTATFVDTIPGFTFSFYNIVDSTKILEFGETKIGFSNCKILKIYNYGVLPKTLTDILISENFEFSIPQSQYDLVIPPGDTLDLEICYRPLKAGRTDRDTLTLMFACEEEKIPLAGESDKLFYDSENRCDAAILIEVGEVPAEFAVGEVVPNPATEKIKIVGVIPDKSEVCIEIYDMLGMKRLVRNYGTMEKGYYEFEFDVSDLESGAYVYEFKAGGKIKTGKFISID